MKRMLSEMLARLRSRRRDPHGDVRARYYSGVRAVTEAPLPATSIGLLGALLLLVVVALVWACTARIDVVAFAQGKAVVTSRVKPVQAAMRARVTKVLVTEGERVVADQPVILLERATAAAGVRGLRDRLHRGRAARARLRTLLRHESGGLPVMKKPPGVPEPILNQAKTQMRSQWAAYRATLAELEGQRANRGAEVATLKATVASIESVLPYLRRHVSRMESLTEKGGASLARLDEARRDLVAKRQERHVQQRQVAEARAGMRLATLQLSGARSRARREWLDELADIERDIASLEQELIKAESRLQQNILRAPITGVVQDLTVRSQGAVVRPAAVLLRIVPEDKPVEVVAKILNRDIGFVREGQTVDVKFAAYDFTRYGAVPGVIRKLSPSSTVDEKLGQVYTALIELERNWISIDGDRMPLRPGLTATVDIALGSRRIIEYFLAPILRYRDQALRER